MSLIAGLAFVIVYLVYLYIRRNDRCLNTMPLQVAAASPHRWTDNEIWKEYKRSEACPIYLQKALPLRTGRRYIVTGGAGFLGGWIVAHLIRRGENPRQIRVLDIKLPTREDLRTGLKSLLDFRICDVADERAVREAFTAPWPIDEDVEDAPELTVFHTAANIRYFERMESQVPLSAAVNVHGTQHVIDAARAAGATVLISTSSGSSGTYRARFWLWPWETSPPFFVQKLSDEKSDVQDPKEQAHFFSNYAFTKRLGETLVRSANGTLSAGNKILRTGCVRPGNGIYGPCGDYLLRASLARRYHPTWNYNIVQNFVHVENTSLAHLCYEQRLLELHAGASQPDIGGQSFYVSDKGDPPTWGDVLNALSILSGGRTIYPRVSPTLILFVSHLFECIFLLRFYFNSLPSPFSLLAHLVPRLSGDLIALQPSIFSLIHVHMLFDDSRARRRPEDGGLGYTPQWTTLQGVCALVREFERDEAAQLADIRGCAKAAELAQVVDENRSVISRLLSLRMGLGRSKASVAGKVRMRMETPLGTDVANANGDVQGLNKELEQ